MVPHFISLHHFIFQSFADLESADILKFGVVKFANAVGSLSIINGSVCGIC